MRTFQNSPCCGRAEDIIFNSGIIYTKVLHEGSKISQSSHDYVQFAQSMYNRAFKVRSGIQQLDNLFVESHVKCNDSMMIFAH